jgi:hypothetical protein
MIMKFLDLLQELLVALFSLVIVVCLVDQDESVVQVLLVVDHELHLYHSLIQESGASPLTLPPPKLDIPDSLSPTGPDKTSTPADSGPSNYNSPLIPELTNGKGAVRDPQPIKPGPPIRPGLPNKPLWLR